MRPTGGLVRHLLRAGALLAPVAYVAQLSATAVHEVVGHGLTAVAVGGRFTRFELAWDGMGRAWTAYPDGAPRGAHLAVLFGGVLSTFLLGACLLAVASRLRAGPARWVVLVLAASWMLEGAPYAFWSAYDAHAGDVGVALTILRRDDPETAAAVRTAILVAAAAATLLGTCLPGVALLRDLESTAPAGASPGRRCAAAAAFAVAAAASWWLFDWEQILPRIGVLPEVAGGATSALPAAWWAATPHRTRRAAPATPGRTTIGAWWAAAAAALALTLLRLGDGVDVG